MPAPTPETSEDIAVATPTLAALNAAGRGANTFPWWETDLTAARAPISQFSRNMLAKTNATAWNNVLGHPTGETTYPTLVSIEEYGAVSLYDSPNFDSTSAFKSHFDAFGVTEFRALYIPGKPYGITAGELVIPKRSGYAIYCNGLCDPRGEVNDYQNILVGGNPIGGGPSRLVKIGGSGPMVFDRSLGLNVVGTLVIQGHRAASRAQLLASSDNYADVGWQVDSNDNEGLGFGKATIQGMAFLCCKQGLVFGSEPLEDNADNWQADFLSFWFCGHEGGGGGVKFVNHQSVAHTWGHLKFHGVGAGCTDYTGIDAIKGGGKTVIQQVAWLPNVGRFLRTHDVGAEQNYFGIGLFKYDETADGSMIWECDASAPVSVCELHIQGLTLPFSLSAPKLATLRGPAKLAIRGGTNWHSNRIETIASGGYTANVILDGLSCATGQTAAASIYPDSVGPANVDHEHCTTVTGARIPAEAQSWSNGVLQ